MLNTFKEIPKKRLRQLIIAALITIVAGFLELYSFVSIKNLFLLLIGKETSLNKTLIEFYPFNYGDNKIFPIIYISILFGILLLISSLTRFLSLGFNQKLGSRIGSEISTKAYSRILNQPYKFFIEKDSSSSISLLTYHTNQFIAINGYLIQLLSSSFIISCILFLLLKDNFLITFFTFLFVFTIYIFSANLFKDQLKKNSNTIKVFSEEQISVVKESIGAIRYIKLGNIAKSYIKNFSLSVHKVTNSQVDTRIISAVPRYILETPGLIIIVGLSIFTSITTGDIANAIPNMASIAFAYQRLLPLSQQIYSSFVFIRGNYQSIKLFDEAFKLPNNNEINKSSLYKEFFKENLKFQDISFKYPNSVKEVFKDVNFQISKGDKIALIGTSGAGKSTLVDIFSGILSPTKGYILVDEKYKLNKNQKYNYVWQNKIAYVPQNIFIANDTIKKNIALGINEKDINIDKIRDSLKKVDLLEFTDSLIYKEQTILGESGVKLSGGQRQRIAIARALYSNKSILILDEATNALDFKTEKKIMQVIKNLPDMITVLIIAHRKETLEDCDRVILIKDKKVTPLGKASHVLKDYFDN